MPEPAFESAIEPKLDLRPAQLHIVLEILKRRLPGREVWAFGSRTKGTAKPYSDLDLAIITSEPMALNLLATLSADFSDSDLPFKVDVADWATTGDAFRAIISRDKMVITRQLTAHENPTQ